MRTASITIFTLASGLLLRSYCLLANTLLSTPGTDSAVEAASKQEERSTSSIEVEFDWINKRLIGPPISAIDYGVNDVDYPAWYTVDDIQDSVTFMEEHQDVLVPFATRLLKTRAREAKMQCDSFERKSASALERGGWCLELGGNSKDNVLFNTSVAIPQNHVVASQRVVTELSNLITREGITSINDFGAGVGQYKSEILKKHPVGLDYKAYDGAGNIVEYTNGFLKYFDLTYPLALPKAEWVLSLEVGEHVPHQHEGMLIRNLHHHNTKGIILSWAILGQGGHSHVNCHSNEYVIRLMESLGYTSDLPLGEKFRQSEDNYYWFHHSIMVFRRNQTGS